MQVPTINDTHLRIDHHTKRLQCKDPCGVWVDWKAPHYSNPEYYAVYTRSAGPDEYPNAGWFNVFTIVPPLPPEKCLIGFRLPYSCFPALTRHEEIERMIEQM